MNQGDKPDLLIYHGPSCLDGLGCVWALHQKWPDVEVFEGVYGQAPPDVTGKRVLVADFSYPEEDMRAMAKVATSLTVLDHHRSSAETFRALFADGLIRGEHDEARSGAALTWHYTWGSPHAPKLIEHIQDRDLWKFDIPMTQEVTSVLASYVGTEGWERAWTEVGRALEAGRQREIFAQGGAILRQRQADMAAVVRAGGRTMIIGGTKVPVCNAPFFWASEIAGAMAEGQPFAATYMDMEDGRRQFSLRSRGEGLEVHTIAEEYGGGGHPHAAGFTAPAGWEGDVEEVHAVPLKGGTKVTVAED